MKKEEMTVVDMLLEAVGIVAALVDVGLQIYYGVLYKTNAFQVLMNLLSLILIYAGLTLFACYPEKVNGLSKEACSGTVRTDTIRMVRLIKLIFMAIILFTSVCDVLGTQINSGYSLLAAVLIAGVAGYYEWKIIRTLRKTKGKKE